MSAIRSVVEDAYDDVVLSLAPEDMLKVDVVGQTTTKAMQALQSLIKTQGLSQDLVKDAANRIAQNLKATEDYQTHPTHHPNTPLSLIHI